MDDSSNPVAGYWIGNIFSTDQLPQFQTRRALLIVDPQNEFLTVDGKLPIRAPTDYISRIKKLVPAFRRAGDVIWVRTEFEAERTVNDAEGMGESVITDNELAQHAISEHGSVDASEDEDILQSESSTDGLSTQTSALPRQAAAGNTGSHSIVDSTSNMLDGELDETFLSSNMTANGSRCCLPGSFGAQFAEEIQALVDEKVDNIMVKTYYSAFNSTDLIPLLRGGLVTELFICGVMSNTSVYATALDAVRHGYSITLLEDCLGHRNKARHEEALRMMSEYMGADVMTSAELIENLGGSDGVEPQDTTPNANPNSLDKKAELEKPPNEADTRRDQSGTSSADSAISLSGDRFNDASTGTVRDELPGSIVGGQPAPSGADVQETRAEHGSSRAPEKREDPLSKGEDEFMITNAEKEQTANKPTLQDVSARPTEIVSDPAATPKPSPLPRSSSSIALETAVAQVVRPMGKDQVHKTHVRGPSVSFLGPGDQIGEGDSRIIHDLLGFPLRDRVFDMLKEEVQFQTMLHRGGEVPRLVAVQGELAEDGSMPVYRHPADESPPLLHFTPTVMEIKGEVERVLGHPVNHVLIQYYRNGQDYISEHSDKTLDIVRHSSIANVSIGGQRTMTLRTKKSAAGQKFSVPKADNNDQPGAKDALASLQSRHTQRILMPHNSMFILGPQTNMRWLHGIRQDKRPSTEKSTAELSYNGERISLTFRQIGTFLHPKSNSIWGQGARSKSKDTASEVIGGGTAEAERMVVAFGRENQASDFDWDAVYGDGFDALDIVMSSPKLYLSGNLLSDLRIQLHLAEAGLKYHLLRPGSSHSDSGSNYESATDSHTRPRFIDSDPEKTEVVGAMAIMVYVEQYYRYHGAFGSSHSRSEVGAALSQFGESQELLKTWQRLCQRTTIGWKQKDSSAGERLKAEKALHRDLQTWEEILASSGSPYIAGKSYTVADSAFWPLLDEIISKWADWDDEEFPELKRYHGRMESRSSVKGLFSRRRMDAQDAPVKEEKEK